jgi:hypothetical protein
VDAVIDVVYGSVLLVDFCVALFDDTESNSSKDSHLCSLAVVSGSSLDLITFTICLLIALLIVLV